MQLTVVGPGRAGLALGIAARAAGHSIVTVVARTRESARHGAALLEAEARGVGDGLAAADLVIVAVRDGAIAEVAAGLATAPLGSGAAVHLSGLASVSELEALAVGGTAVGSFHPLQTLPSPEAGAAALRGAWVGITAADPTLGDTLRHLAVSLGAHPFHLAEQQKATYHAAAAAAANFPLAALVMAHDLFDAAGVPFEAAQPLVEAVVANAFAMGPRSALTGPVARGDVATVREQLDAVAAEAPHLAPGFLSFVAELARLSGRSEEFEGVVGGEDAR